jgi:hypothetical protein
MGLKARASDGRRNHVGRLLLFAVVAVDIHIP